MSNTGFLSQLAHLFAIIWALFSAAVKGAFALLRFPFASKPDSQPTVLPHYIPPLSRVDITIDLAGPTPSATLGAPSTDASIMSTPDPAVMPAGRTPKPHLPIPQKTSPTTA
ncbi:hypothetical protein B0J17DRAFT_719242 [Rhizoctonia solani]|nr:hypothetical protein B0J17DRAFT_719242 [Rhizoctonia solani]